MKETQNNYIKTISMEFLEKDLEQVIWETDKEFLSNRGLEVFGYLRRQLNIGRYGVADLVSFEKIGYKKIHFCVYELKKDHIGISAFLQAYNYVKGISSYLESRGFTVFYDVVLIGKGIDTSGSFCYLPDLIDNLIVYRYKVDINGLSFLREVNYELKNAFSKIK